MFFFFRRIMMLSVMKNTKSPVKFWFLKNFLSPSLTVSFTRWFDVLTFYVVFRGQGVLTGVLHCISCVRQRENIFKKLNQVLLYFVITFFFRRSCLTWPKNMVLSTNLCNTTGLTGCMLKQKSRGSFGGEYKVNTGYPTLVFA